MTTVTKQSEDKLARARQSAKDTYDAIADMVRRLEAADDDDVYEALAPELAKTAGYAVKIGRGRTWRWVSTKDKSKVSADRYSEESEAWVACCDDNGLRPDADSVREEIQEDPLSVQVRSGWYTPGETPEVCEYEILLGTGGPAVRIVGDLRQYNEPDRARLECQDWFTPWTEVFDVDNDVLLTYARCFYFGE